LMMRDHDADSWMPSIIKTVATENKGIVEIADEVDRHHQFLNSSGNFLKRRENRVKLRIKDIVEEKIRQELWGESRENSLNSSLEKVVLGNLSPYHIAENIIEDFKKNLE
ncbi:MAG: methylmalonyl Co-A mutase-associated GTPase MeaB, partial [Ignavibacteriales bacterium]